MQNNLKVRKEIQKHFKKMTLYYNQQLDCLALHTGQSLVEGDNQLLSNE